MSLKINKNYLINLVLAVITLSLLILGGRYYNHYVSAYTDITLNSKILNGFNSPDKSILEAIKIIEKNKLGKTKINFRLKDWGVSRQRYWGCPIPIAYNKNNKIIKVPLDRLPIKLPENINLNFELPPRYSKYWHQNIKQARDILQKI